MLKLLIVDDESLERESIRFIIERQGIAFDTIMEAVHGQDAITKASDFEPDIILMDIKMPGIDGIEASKLIRKFLPQVRIIIQTAFDQFDYAKEAIHIGVDDFIVKPTSSERLVEVLSKTIQSIREERQALQQQEEIKDKLSQVSLYLEQEFVVNLVQGDIDEEQAKEYFSFMNIDFKFGYGIAIRFHYSEGQQKSLLQKQMIKKRFADGLKKRLGQIRHPFYMTTMKDVQFVLLYSCDQSLLLDRQQLVRGFVVEAGEQVMNQFDIYIDFGIGDIYDSISCLWKSFSQAKNMCNRKLSSPQDDNRSDYMNKIANCVVEGDEERIGGLLEEFHELLLRDIVDHDRYKIKLYEAFILIEQRITELSNIKKEEYPGLIDRTLNLQNYSEGRLLFMEMIHERMSHIKQMKNDRTSPLIDKIITHINAHYAENLTLEQMAEMISFTPHYLSKLFKKHLDMNFIDYVASIRHKVAKRLLRNDKYSIKEIGQAVGYDDPNYFARVFKKWEQVTPTEYRAKYYDRATSKNEGEVHETE